ncbi:hypothetical protein AAFP30_05475 [Gordonia sp. CPCC 205515]|uniref:TY-Chap domain-containing protein n=1 Tax=Gordonia sp. CPCC 205515 TaxID=3140791 RepID=UPI003AF3802D
MSTNDFDVSDADRSELATALAGHVADLADGASVIVVRDDDPDQHPLIEFRLTSARRIRATIDGEAIGATGIAANDHVGETLAALGWRHLPTKREYIAEAGRKGADELAQTVVETLREVWGRTGSSVVLVDPEAPESDPEEAVEPEASPHLSAVPDLVEETEQVAESEPPAEPAESVTSAAPEVVGCSFEIPPVFPNDPENLLALAHAALSALMETHLPIDDGAIVLSAPGGPRTRVSTTGRGFWLRFTAQITDRLPAPAALGELLVEHCARWPEVAILAGDDGVFAERIIESTVFHPLTLELMLPDWLDFVGGTLPRYIADLKPAGAEPHPSTPTIPPALQVLLAEHTDDQPLTAERIAEFCAGRPVRLRSHLEACRTVADGWRAIAQDLRANGADDEADVYAEMQQQFEGFAGLIDAAIVMVEVERT